MEIVLRSPTTFLGSHSHFIERRRSENDVEAGISSLQETSEENLLINVEIAESTRRLSVRKRVDEISNMHSERKSANCRIRFSVRHKGRKFGVKSQGWKVEWREQMDGVPRSWKSHERRSLYFPATHVLRKTCIRMENPHDLIERVRVAEQARLVNSCKRAFQPENIGYDDILHEESNNVEYNIMEIQQVLLKTRAEFGKQCFFDVWGPNVDVEIKPDPDAMVNYITRTHCNVGVQHTKQFALHEAQTIGTQTKSSGMFHFEGGWPKEINPKDEEATMRFRRRVEKDEDWAPKLRNLFQKMEHNILQNGALNIYEHYFDDMIPTELVKPRNLRTVNVYEDPQTPTRPVNNISWSPDSGSKMVVSYCFFGIEPDYSNIAYIWQIDNPNKPWMMLEAPSATVVNEFNPRDPSVLASGLMSGQVCSWDIRTGTSPVQMSHRQFSHRDFTTVVKWIATKSNTEFFSGSSDGRAMWWDTRHLRQPTEILVFDLQMPNEPDMDRAIGVASADYEPSVGTKFMFGLENGIVISGSKKARTPAEKLALRFNAHYGPVLSVDRSAFNPKIFLTVGDCIIRVWAEDTKDSNLVSTRLIIEDPACGCWNKTRHSIFYLATRTGMLTVWDLLVGMQDPILTMKLCEEKLTAIAAHETGALLAVGNSAGNVYLIESTEALYTFDKNERNDLTSYLERCSHFVKAIDTRLKEIKLAKTATEEALEPMLDLKDRKKNKRPINEHDKRKIQEKVKDPREKSKIKELKKKLKDEFPELQEVEDKFFDIVKKEKQKYIEYEDLDTSPEKLARSIKKVVSRKIEKNALNKPKKIETKISPKKILKEDREKYPTKTEISATEIVQDIEQEKVMAEVIVESPVKEISKRKRRKKPRKKRPMLVAFRLPRPCKIGVCIPRICCRRTTFGKLRIRARTSIESKEKIRQKRRKSWTKLMRAHKRKELTKKYDKERISPGEEMTISEELAVMMEDVNRAKREIQEIGIRTRRKIRKPAKKIWESCVTVAEESQDTSRGKDVRGKEVTSMPKSFLAAEKARKARRIAVTVDPCVPWEPPSLAKDLQTFLRGPLPESIEKKERPSVIPNSEEIELSHCRLYPRISDFHSVE